MSKREEENQPSRNEIEKKYSKVIGIIMEITHLCRDLW
jgi:hypothetical protein